MMDSSSENSDEIIKGLTAIDFVVLSAMHETDLKTMMSLDVLELIKSCEKFFDCNFMQKMKHEPSPELKTKIQNWLNSIQYKQYIQNTNQTLSVQDKQSIRKIYLKLGLKFHDLSELTDRGKQFLEKINADVQKEWGMLVKYHQTNNPTKLKEEMDECGKFIPIMFTSKIATPRLFSDMFKMMNLSMYDYLSKDKEIHPIFLEYLK